MGKKRELTNEILYGMIPATSGACLWHSGIRKILEEVLCELSLEQLEYIFDEQIQFVYVLKEYEGKENAGTIEEFPISGVPWGEKLRVLITHNLEGKPKREVKESLRDLMTLIFQQDGNSEEKRDKVNVIHPTPWDSTHMNLTNVPMGRVLTEKKGRYRKIGELKEGNMTGLIDKFLEEKNLSLKTRRVRRMILMSFQNWLEREGYKSIGV